MRTVALAAAAVVAMSAPAVAAPRLLTLAEAQAIALANHPTIKAGRFDTAAALEAVNIARSVYSPQVYGSAVTAFAPEDTRVSAYLGGITDPTILSRTGTGLVVSQYITDFGRTAETIKADQLASKAQSEKTQATESNVVLNVAQAYFQALRADALLRVADQTVRERQTLLSRVSALQHAGLSSTLDVAVARRDAASAEQLVVDAQTARRDAIADLNEAMGSSGDDDFKLADVRNVPQLPRSLGRLIDETISSNPGLAALRDQVAAAQAMVSAVRLETKPVVTAYGYFGATPWHLVSEEINSAYAAAGVSLVVPISDGGVLKAEARQAEDQASSLTESSTDLQNRLLRDTRTAYDDVLAARNDIGVTDEMVRTARESYRLTAARFRIGLNSIVDLSQAQLALTQARVARANALYDYVERGAGLEYVTGALVPASTARP